MKQKITPTQSIIYVDQSSQNYQPYHQTYQPQPQHQPQPHSLKPTYYNPNPSIIKNNKNNNNVSIKILS